MTENGDQESRKALGSVGSLLAAAGVGIVVPGFQDAAIAWLNRHSELELNLDAPLWVGCILILFAVPCLILAFFGQSRIGRFVSFWKPNGSNNKLIAIKSVGFAPTPRDIYQGDLPQSLEAFELVHHTIDISMELSASTPSIQMAIQKHSRFEEQLETLLGLNPGAKLAYYGIVHAPFQFLAGYQLSSWSCVQAFEWRRHDACWEAIASGDGKDLMPLTIAERVSNGIDIAIAIEISYGVDNAEILSSFPQVGAISRVRVAEPKLDCISSKGQIDEVARQFRAILDEARTLRPGARIHVCCAAPMSVGVALGRMVSRTLHPPLNVYAYNRGSARPYSWGLLINGPSGPVAIT